MEPPVYFTCTHCNASKPSTGFYRNARKRNGLSSWCKECSHEAIRALNQKRREQDYPGREANHYTRHSSNFVRFVKSKTSCWFCEEDSPYALDFHHIEPGEKEINISRNMPVRKVMEEMAKCAVLCKNCHAKGHAGVIDFTEVTPLSVAIINDLFTEFAREAVIKGKNPGSPSNF